MRWRPPFLALPDPRAVPRRDPRIRPKPDTEGIFVESDAASSAYAVDCRGALGASNEDQRDAGRIECVDRKPRYSLWSADCAPSPCLRSSCASIEATTPSRGSRPATHSMISFAAPPIRKIGAFVDLLPEGLVALTSRLPVARRPQPIRQRLWLASRCASPRRPHAASRSWINPNITSWIFSSCPG